MAATMTETELKDAVIDLAHLLGYLVHHDRPAQNRRGDWATHIQGDAGFVDLVLAKNGRVLLPELKSEKGRLTDEQAAWGRAIGEGTHSYLLWRPENLLNGDIEKVLKREGNR